MSDLYVLDTSAIFTFTDKEDGAGKVEKLLDAARVNKCHLKVCAISLMEIYYITLMEQGEDEAARLVGLVKSWPCTLVYPDEKMLLQGGKLKVTYQEKEIVLPFGISSGWGSGSI